MTVTLSSVKEEIAKNLSCHFLMLCEENDDESFLEWLENLTEEELEILCEEETWSQFAKRKASEIHASNYGLTPLGQTAGELGNLWKQNVATAAKGPWYQKPFAAGIGTAKTIGDIAKGTVSSGYEEWKRDYERAKQNLGGKDSFTNKALAAGAATGGTIASLIPGISSLKAQRDYNRGDISGGEYAARAGLGLIGAGSLGKSITSGVTGALKKVPTAKVPSPIPSRINPPASKIPPVAQTAKSTDNLTKLSSSAPTTPNNLSNVKPLNLKPTGPSSPLPGAKPTISSSIPQISRLKVAGTLAGVGTAALTAAAYNGNQSSGSINTQQPQTSTQNVPNSTSTQANRPPTSTNTNTNLNRQNASGSTYSRSSQQSSGFGRTAPSNISPGELVQQKLAGLREEQKTNAVKRINQIMSKK